LLRKTTSSQQRTIPCCSIIVKEHSPGTAEESAIKAGADDFMVKGFTIDELVVAINRIMAKKL